MPVRMKRVLTVVLVTIIGVWSVYAMGQPGGQKAPPGGKGGGGGGKGKAPAGEPANDIGNVQVLLNEKVKTELELTEDQVGQIRSLSERFRRRMLGFANQRGEKKSEELDGLREEFKMELKEILLPRQIDRFDQILVQKELEADTLTALTGTGELAKKLGVTEEQKKQLRAASREADEAVHDAMEKLRDEARQKVIDALSAEQKEQLTKLIGEPFEGNFRAAQKKGPGNAGPGGSKGAKGSPKGPRAK